METPTPGTSFCAGIREVGSPKPMGGPQPMRARRFSESNHRDPYRPTRVLALIISSCTFHMNRHRQPSLGAAEKKKGARTAPILALVIEAIYYFRSIDTYGPKIRYGTLYHVCSKWNRGTVSPTARPTKAWSPTESTNPTIENPHKY